MNKISFFYSADDVFNTSVKALKKRDYKIIEVNEEEKSVKAKFKKGLLSPEVIVEMKVERINDTQSNLKIVSDAKGGFLSPKGYETKAEQKLVNTLYRLFDRI